MASIYFFRHQAAGIMHEFPMLGDGTPNWQPSIKQTEAAYARCCANHGATHPKTGDSMWMTVVEVKCLGPNDLIPAVEERGTSMRDPGGEIAVGLIGAHGIATVGK